MTVTELPEPLAEEPQDEPRRYPSTVGGLLYLLVLAAVGVGLVIAWRDDWRDGVRWIGAALLAAAALRLVLRRKDAGMLAVRHRLFDVFLLAAVGTALIFLAGDIPNQPGELP